MTRKRLTREESRELTSQRLVDAAKRLIARRGLDATSVEDFADAAGYSRGAFYSNFKSKNDLFFEVLRQDQEQINAEFAQTMDDTFPVEDIRRRIREIYGVLYRDSDAFLAWTEARMLSARDAKFRARLTALIEERRDFVARLLGYLCKRIGATPSVPLETLAMGFVSLSEGLRLFGAACPSVVSAEMAQSTQDLFIDAVLQQVMQRGTSSRGR